MAELKEVNLALGGGGAKGFVHLGVLEELTNRKIEIKSIVATSIGAIIGALFAYYAAELYKDRKNPQQLAAKAVSSTFLTTSFWKLSDVNFLSLLTQGIFRGKKISAWLSEHLTRRDDITPLRFGELDFPLTITATDAHTGRSHILNKENEPGMFIHEAVRASMSIQYVFKAVWLEIGGTPTLCWDGGTTGNCRFDLPQKLYPGRRTLASSLTYRGQVVSTETGLIGAWMRPLKVLNHTTAILMRAVEEGMRECMPEEAKKEIIFVDPLLSTGRSLVGTYNFHLNQEQREALIKNGRIAVAKALDGSIK